MSNNSLQGSIKIIEDLVSLHDHYQMQKDLLVQICKAVGAIHTNDDGNEVAKPSDILTKIESLKFRAGLVR